MANSAALQQHDFDDELAAIRRKRALLDRLITFTKQVHQLAGSFDIIKELAKPSQRTNKKYLKVLYEAMQTYEGTETTTLQHDLKDADHRIQQRLQQIIALSMMREPEFLKLFETEQNSEDAVTRIHAELKAFEVALQQNLAMRYVLDKRGAMLKACQLPISQEDVRNHADRIKKEEAACVKRVRSKISEILADTERTLALPGLTPELIDQLNTVRVNLKQKAESLDTDNMDQALTCLQNFDLDAAVAQKDKGATGANKTKSKRTTGKTVPEKHNTKPESEPEEKLTGVKAFVRWLNTPWGVSYDEVKQKKK